jgi:protoporphyrinogen oxidase
LAKWREAGIVTLAIKSLTERKNIKRRVIHYPDGGIDHIPQVIARSVEDAGAEFFLSTEAVAIEHKKNGVTVTTKRGGEVQTLEGDLLVSTIPVTKLIAMLTPPVPYEVKEAVDRLRYRTLLLLYIFVNKERLLRDQCIYFTEKPFLFRRITEFKHLDPTMTPKGKTSLCVEMTCFDEDPLLREKEETIFRRVAGQLERAGYLRQQNVEGYQFLRVPFAYPVYEIVSSKILHRVLGALKSCENLISIGRQGLFFYNAMNSSIMMGHELGEDLGKFGKKDWHKVIQRAYKNRIEKYVLRF